MDFQIIGFTEEKPFKDPSDEANQISNFLRSGAIDFFHIRKYGADDDYIRNLILSIPSEFHNQLILHSHPHLFEELKVGGIHLKGNQAYIKKGNEITSRSFHSPAELMALEVESPYSYVFLSPVFDSLSKQGYLSRLEEFVPFLDELGKKFKIVALGGVTPDNINKLFTLKFAGAALLGYLWSPKLNTTDKIEKLLQARKNLLI